MQYNYTDVIHIFNFCNILVSTILFNSDQGRRQNSLAAASILSGMQQHTHYNSKPFVSLEVAGF